MSEQPDLPPSFNPQSYRRPAPRDKEKMETKRLGIIVVAIAAVLVVAVLARSFFAGHSSDTNVRDTSGTPVITAGSAPVKSAPANAGGLQVAGADQDVQVGSTGAGAANGQLAPAAKTPAPAKLAAQAPAVPAPAVVSAKEQSYVMPMKQPPLPVTEPVAVAKSFTEPAPAAPTTKRRHHHERQVAKAEATTAEATPAAQRVAAPEAAIAGGGKQVQLGAVISEEEARKEWRRLKAKMPDLLAGHEPRITTVDRNGNTLYRLRTDGFADLAAARAFCGQVKDKGERCSVF